MIVVFAATPPAARRAAKKLNLAPGWVFPHSTLDMKAVPRGSAVVYCDDWREHPQATEIRAEARKRCVERKGK